MDELKSVADRIDEKYHYLLDAPETDPAGNRAVVRFSRKSKSQYVMTEQDGKPTGWVATFNGMKWLAKSEAGGEKAPAGKKAAGTTASKDAPKKTTTKKAAAKKPATKKTTAKK